MQLSTAVVDSVLPKVPNEGEQAYLCPTLYIEAEMSIFIPGNETFLILDTPVLLPLLFLLFAGFGHASGTPRGGGDKKSTWGSLEKVYSYKVQQNTHIPGF